MAWCTQRESVGPRERICVFVSSISIVVEVVILLFFTLGAGCAVNLIFHWSSCKIEIESLLFLLGQLVLGTGCTAILIIDWTLLFGSLLFHLTGSPWDQAAQSAFVVAWFFVLVL